ncbi:hypothetical protein NLJ89_g5336 [Agrocybe chaxingu]|uniref:Uncharacterized protein n=1 Tax=Agrocybe chaxingu TaxID=84603 RepID=A0A9W8K181_9AGAR|nr:hypothetical protein NLJ89_g5336 [Agrocybe chaxingu]
MKFSLLSSVVAIAAIQTGAINIPISSIPISQAAAAAPSTDNGTVGIYPWPSTVVAIPAGTGSTYIGGPTTVTVGPSPCIVLVSSSAYPTANPVTVYTIAPSSVVVAPTITVPTVTFATSTVAITAFPDSENWNHTVSSIFASASPLISSFLPPVITATVYPSSGLFTTVYPTVYPGPSSLPICPIYGGTTSAVLNATSAVSSVSGTPSGTSQNLNNQDQNTGSATAVRSGMAGVAVGLVTAFAVLL